MMTKADVAAVITQDWQSDHAVYCACQKLLEYLIRNQSKQLHLTYASLRKITQSTNDRTVLLATQYFTGTRVSLLKPGFEFIDSGERIYQLTKSEVVDAEHSGVLIHPDTGEPISNYAEQVYIYFSPTELVSQISAME